jgi:Fic family protein
LLTNLLLLQHGYDFISLVSHEKLIEARKAEYYLALNRAQGSWKSRTEDVTPWLSYFLSILKAQADQAITLIESDNIEALLSEKQLTLWQWAQARNEPTFGRKDAIEALEFPARTVESIIRKLLELKRLERIGEGRGTRYRVVRQ